MREFHYRWQFDLKSAPEELWPLVADTNRFNRDTGVPAVEAVPGAAKLKNARRLLRLSVLGVPVEWEEQPFEWIRPSRFGVVRRYTKGPIVELRVQAELIPRSRFAAEAGGAAAGTRLVYEVWAKPRNIAGLLAIPIQIGLLSARTFTKTFHEYDELAHAGRKQASQATTTTFARGGRERLLSLSERLRRDGGRERLVGLLVDQIENADDYALARMRPYELADQWSEPRREVLELCLMATRAGILDLQWNLICPICRAGGASDSLKDVSSQVHCEGCNIDFKVNFEQSVELTFRPNPSIRTLEAELFCVGGPEVTPHRVAQQLLPAHTDREISLTLNEGRYRLRTLLIDGWQHLRVGDPGQTAVNIQANGAWPNDETAIAPQVKLKLDNATDDEQLFILERTQWSDTAATAAEVTALQMFRDLFASEALRPGEQISVGTLTVLFTDLKNSTRLYREIGDATAFGRVMNHFDVLRQTIAEENGALVKTIGDAVMAVFRHPASALRAMLDAQQRLASPAGGMQPLSLKAGIHSGPCIAVTLNDRLDYFGSTVNLAARLEGQSTGNDVVISSAVYDDPEIRDMLSNPVFTCHRFEIPLKGFDEESFELWRVGLQNADLSG
jgi:class 3 adenylate cyclase